MDDFIHIAAVVVVVFFGGMVLGMFLICNLANIYFPTPALVLIPMAFVSVFSLLSLHDRNHP